MAASWDMVDPEISNKEFGKSIERPIIAGVF